MCQICRVKRQIPRDLSACWHAADFLPPAAETRLRNESPLESAPCCISFCLAGNLVQFPPTDKGAFSCQTALAPLILKHCLVNVWQHPSGQASYLPAARFPQGFAPLRSGYRPWFATPSGIAKAVTDQTLPDRQIVQNQSVCRIRNFQVRGVGPTLRLCTNPVVRTRWLLFRR